MNGAGRNTWIAFVAIVIVLGAYWVANNPINFSTTGFVAKDVTYSSALSERVLVKPHAKQDSAILKGGADVEHEFSDGSFSIARDKVTATMNEKADVESLPVMRIPQPAENIAAGSCAPRDRTPWGIEKIGGGSGGKGIVVAVLDTGVARHPDISVSECMDTTRRGIKKGCMDDNGHGTHIAGIIAANGGKKGSGIIGVAPDASLLAVKVCGANGGCWADDIAEGIYWAVNNGANIISMSFGGADSELIRNAIEYGASKGVLFVAAAGNDGPSDGSIDYPAAYANVIGVGAIASDETVPSWSSRGINYQTTAWVVEERDIELAAPGVGIESTWNDGCYRTLSGTSMAAPHIAGLAAKLWQGSWAATRAHLQYIARYNHADIGRTGDDPDAGFGLAVA